MHLVVACALARALATDAASRRIFLIFGHEGTILGQFEPFWYPVQCHVLELMISSLMETTVWGAPLER